MKTVLVLTAYVAVVLCLARLGLELFSYMTSSFRNTQSLLGDEIRLGAGVFCVAVTCSAIVMALVSLSLLFYPRK